MVGRIAVPCLGAVLALAVLLSATARAETCRASYYGAESGHRTANGEVFQPEGLSVALRRRPGRGRAVVSYRVSYNGRSVIVRHNDFGPAARLHRCADLSHGAAVRLGLTGPGVARVTIERR